MRHSDLINAFHGPIELAAEQCSIYWFPSDAACHEDDQQDDEHNQ